MNPLAITGVTVIDVASGRRLPDQTVVVRGSRISDRAALDTLLAGVERVATGET